MGDLVAPVNQKVDLTTNSLVVGVEKTVKVVAEIAIKAPNELR
jgi:hypothetical protein